MDSASKLTVETPEQIGLEFELAGLGSRLLAALIDFLCMLAFLIAALAIAFGAIESGQESWKQVAENASQQAPWTQGLGVAATILVFLSIFLVQWGYYIICEMVTGGASPGKRALGLRVIRDNGLPIGFVASLLRNLVRFVDFLPWGYGVGLVAVFASARGQRLGDLAAGTLVVKVAAPAGTLALAPPDPLPVTLPAPRPVRPPALPAPAWTPAGAPGLTPDERDLVLRFLARSGSLLPEARLALARQIAAPLGARLGRSGGTLDDEAWLAALLRDGGPPP